MKLRKIMSKSIILLVTLSFNISASDRQQVVAKHGMVVSEQFLASEVGTHILKAGGNAIDAAVAVGYALAVVNPCCGNIGGGGFMTIHFANGKNIFINFREKAPLAAKADMYLDKNKNLIPESTMVGYLAVGVPGTVLGLETVLKKYGTMNRQQVMAPAIKLANEGYILTTGDVVRLQEQTQAFSKQPNVAKIFLKKNNQPFQVGDRFKQKDLATTLKLISLKGSDIFYKGIIAKSIVDVSKKHGGILTLNDFSSYTVQELTPIICHYEDYDIISAPPPSSGGVTLCEMLNVVEKYPLKKLGFHSAKSTHYIVEAMRYAFYDRNYQLGDPDFVKNPVDKLISKDYADQLQQRILDVKATPSSELIARETHQEGVHTTHYSILDKQGNAVSATVTLNSFFGAKVIAGNTGFFLNNEMDDFTAKVGDTNKFGLVQGENNGIEAGKRPLSSMAPTIILKDNKLVMIVGSPGGPRIITSTLLTILNVLDYKMNIQEAVDAPRYHHQWLPDSIYTEPNTFTKDVITSLSDMGYHFTPTTPWGAVEAIYIDPKTHLMYGGSDKRRVAGKAAGY